jgi:hypothetical protein
MEAMLSASAALDGHAVRTDSQLHSPPITVTSQPSWDVIKAFIEIHAGWKVCSFVLIPHCVMG